MLGASFDRSVFVSGARVKRSYDVCTNSLRSWASSGKIRSRTLPGGKHLYALDDVHKLLQPKEGPPVQERISLAYARVSSDHQKEDLKRQVDLLKSHRPGIEVVQDVGSGVNFQRKGLLSLLERVLAGTIQQVVVLHRDRLCRIACDLFEHIFQKAGCQLVVLGDDQTGHDSERELSDDLLSIVTVFVARSNGRRSASHKRQRAQTAKTTLGKRAQKDPGETSRETGSKRGQGQGEGGQIGRQGSGQSDQKTQASSDNDHQNARAEET